MARRYTTAGRAIPSSVANGRFLSDNNSANLTDRRYTTGVRATPSNVANGRVLSDNNNAKLTDRRYTTAVRATPSSLANGRVLSDNNNQDLTDRRYTGRQGNPQQCGQWERSVGQQGGLDVSGFVSMQQTEDTLWPSGQPQQCSQR